MMEFKKIKYDGEVLIRYFKDNDSVELRSTDETRSEFLTTLKLLSQYIPDYLLFEKGFCDGLEILGLTFSKDTDGNEAVMATFLKHITG